MIEHTGLAEADPLDLLVHLAWNEPLATRFDRVRRVRRERAAFFERYAPEARAILDELLDKYAAHGPAELSTSSLQVPPLSSWERRWSWLSRFGGAEPCGPRSPDCRTSCTPRSRADAKLKVSIEFQVSDVKLQFPYRIAACPATVSCFVSSSTGSPRARPATSPPPRRSNSGTPTRPRSTTSITATGCASTGASSGSPSGRSSFNDELVRWVLWSHDRGAVSHDTAAAAHELGVANPAYVHLTVPPGFRMREPGVVLHFADLPADDVTMLDGARITTPLRTVLDIAATHYDEEFVEAVVDRCARDPQGHPSPPSRTPWPSSNHLRSECSAA